MRIAGARCSALVRAGGRVLIAHKRLACSSYTAADPKQTRSSSSPLLAPLINSFAQAACSISVAERAAEEAQVSAALAEAAEERGLARQGPCTTLPHMSLLDEALCSSSGTSAATPGPLRRPPPAAGAAQHPPLPSTSGGAAVGGEPSAGGDSSANNSVSSSGTSASGGSGDACLGGGQQGRLQEGGGGRPCGGLLDSVQQTATAAMARLSMEAVASGAIEPHDWLVRCG